MSHLDARGSDLTHRSRRREVRALAAGLAAAAVLVLGTMPALAGGGERGDPQPELDQFGIGNVDGGSGTGAVLPDGDLVIATPSSSGTTIDVCVLHPGSRACVHTTVLHAYTGGGGDSFYGSVEVLATGGNDVSVVAEDCCYLDVGGIDGGAVVFDSTDGGTSFTGEIPAGTIQSIGAATYFDGQIIVGTVSTGSMQVQAFPVDPGTAVTTLATTRAGDDGSTSLTTSGSGVLLASDDTTDTHVQYATSDFNTASSWTTVGTFANETVTAVSGAALLTDPGGSLTGGERIRFFNGTSFGAAHAVPDSKAGDDGYFAMQEAAGSAHVFFIGRRDSYDVFAESTGTGASWSPLQQFTVGSAINDGLLSPVLGPTGAGVVVQIPAGGTPVVVQPILLAQHVHVSLSATHLKAGHEATLSGSASPRLAGQAVTLQRLDAGEWYSVSTTHESATGSFSFRVPALTRTYRAVVNEKLGYYEYGYSNAVGVVLVK